MGGTSGHIRVDESKVPRQTHCRSESPCLGARHRAAERRESIVPPALVAWRVGSIASLLDEAIRDQSLERAVQRAGPETQAPGGSNLDLIHDRVPVTLAIAEREQHVERAFAQRQELVGPSMRRGHRHTNRLRRAYRGTTRPCISRSDINDNLIL